MSRVIATGSYLPSHRITNDAFIHQTGIDSTDEWIVQRTGVKARRFATDESVADLAVQAAEAMLASVEQEVRASIRLIIVASMSSGCPTPSVANQVQAALGITQAWGFDVNGACSGFTQAFDIAEKMSRSFDSGHILVIGADKMSQVLDLSDRSSSIIFGDGAGCVLIACDGEGLPNYCSQLSVIEDKTQSITLDKAEESTASLKMLGRDVFNFVNRCVIPSVDQFLHQLDTPCHYLVSHQANERLLDLMSQKLGMDRRYIPSNIAEVANTSSASIPILLDQLVQEHKITLSGNQTVMLLGFGGGLAYGINYCKL